MPPHRVKNDINLADDDKVTDFKALGISADVIAESTAGTGVTIDGSLIKDLDIKVDTISESTSGTGVTIDGVLLKDTVVGNAVRNRSSAPNGYGAGAGGEVTQITNASTSVTLNKPCGRITTVALTTAAGAEERFTVSNNLVNVFGVISLSTTYDGAGTPALSVVNVSSTAFDIVITNLHAANALDALMVINFAVTEVVTS